MADPLDVLTLAEGRTAINAGSATNDVELAQQISAVSAVIDAEAGAVVQRVVTDEIHDGGLYGLTTRLWPVVEFTTVTDDLDGTPTEITGYAREPFDRMPGLYSGRIEQVTAGPFTTGRWNVSVTYVAGRYETTDDVAARFKTCAASVLRRLWKREAGTWAQSPEFFEQFDTAATGSGFYRVAKPIIDELLADELDRYSYVRQRHYGIA